MNDVLRQIVERTRRDLLADPIDERIMRAAAAAVAARRAPHRFAEAIRGNGQPRIIAEIKAASPSAGMIIADPDAASIARAYADGGAAAISVVTEPHFFRGSRAWLSAANDASGRPVLMKDFIVSGVQLLRGIAAGADAVLLLASVLESVEIREYIALAAEFRCDALVEVHDESELAKAIDAGASIIGVNNRNLRDFTVDLATAERLDAEIPAGTTRVAESGIRTSADIERLRSSGFHAFLVGESLLRAADRADAVRRLAS
ncbi:MAG: indole-3-glycerol phosphate synthase TrpC [Thermoanaerobaculia bacterium]